MVHLAAGLILIGLGIWGMAAWWSLFGLVMRGVIPFLLLFTGMIAIMASVRRLSRPEVAGANGVGRFGQSDQEPLEAAEPSAVSPQVVDDDLMAENELVRRGLVPGAR